LIAEDSGLPERAVPAKSALSDRALALYAAALGFLVFFALGYLTLQRAHPEEDAYIMFRYVENLVGGHGIVFNAAGPRAEGGTDFVWMLLLATLTAVGVDVAVAALFWNAVGAGLAAWLRARALPGATSRPLGRASLHLLVVPAVVLLSGATAAYCGFSSMLYSALAVLTIHLSLEAGARSISWFPALILLIALFRPDGVLIGAGAAVAGGLRAHRLGRLRPYVFALLAAGLCGAAYYAFRYRYFGLPLPLPLYVKSRVGELDKVLALPKAVQWLFIALPGLGANLNWVLKGGALVAFVVLGLASVLVYRRERTLRPWLARAASALPVVA
jgi:hypothetical protein